MGGLCSYALTISAVTVTVSFFHHTVAGIGVTQSATFFSFREGVGCFLKGQFHSFCKATANLRDCPLLKLK